MSTIPARKAYLVASYTLFTSSFRNIFFLWVIMVCMLETLSAAISFTLIPLHINFNISISEGVSMLWIAFCEGDINIRFAT